MSIKVQNGVWECGPDDRTQLLILLAIADNADDFGFGSPGHALIARKARCDVRTVIRQIAELETLGWLAVLRKAINGRANAYFINTGKLGVTMTPDAFLSPLHARLRREHSDTLSRIFARKNSGDTSEFSSDNPQAPQVTSQAAQVTKEAVSGDTRSHSNSGIVSTESSFEPCTNVQSVPLVAEPAPQLARSFAELKTRLKQHILGNLPSAVQDKRYPRLQADCNDWESAFAWWSLADFRVLGGEFVFITRSPDVRLTRAGLDRYGKRVMLLAREIFTIPHHRAIKFYVLDVEALNSAA